MHMTPIRRDGVKGGLFGVDILFTNGAMQWQEQVPASLPLAKFERNFTKVKFCQEWARATIRKTPC